MRIFLSGQEQDKDMSIVTTFIQQNIGSPSHSNQTRTRKKKGIQIGKGRVKHSLLQLT